MTRAATPKLATYVACSGSAMIIGFTVGQAELIVLAAPFLVALIAGLANVTTPEIEATVHIGAERILEGDLIEVVVMLASTTTCEAEVGLAVPDTFDLLEQPQPASVHLVGGAATSCTFRLRARRWGARRIGIIGVRVYTPARLVVFEELFDCSVLMKVYPSFERITRAIPPLETRMYSGDYVSREVGDGIEFASVRPFTRGDSIRRVNWRITSRTRTLHVNLAHPERDTNVVLFLDTFTDNGMEDESTLDLTVRGAAALAQHHLKHHDRVGLVGFGGTLRWLTASMGRTHAYRVADFLLDISSTFSYAWKDIDLLPTGMLPAGALVIAFTPLIDRRALGALADITDRGFPLTVVNTLDETQIPAAAGPEGALAHRAWRLQREMTRSRLRSAGVPVVDWNGRTGLHQVLTTAPRRTRRAPSFR